MNAPAFFKSILKSNVSPGFWSQCGWALLRAFLGIMMVHNGMDKLSDIQGFSKAYVEVIGLPFPLFFSYVAALTELVGAPLVAIGLLTRPASLALFGTMCVAMYHHVLVSGFNIPYLELSAVYAASFLFFAANGAGLFSFDALILSRLDASALSTRARQVMRLERAFYSESSEQASSLMK
ncbi:MAG: DoxX family protein [Synechococcus sp.]